MNLTELEKVLKKRMHNVCTEFIDGVCVTCGIIGGAIAQFRKELEEEITWHIVGCKCQEESDGECMRQLRRRVLE